MKAEELRAGAALVAIACLSACSSGAPADPQTGARREPVTHPAARISMPAPNARIGTRLEVRGEVRGFWFFEASLSLLVQTEAGEVLAESPASAIGEWMTREFVPFSETLSLSPVAKETAAVLIIRRNNPSDLRENDAEVQIPITLVPP